MTQIAQSDHRAFCEYPQLFKTSLGSKRRLICAGWSVFGGRPCSLVGNAVSRLKCICLYINGQYSFVAKLGNATVTGQSSKDTTNRRNMEQTMLKQAPHIKPTTHSRSVEKSTWGGLCLNKFYARETSITKTCLYNFDPLKTNFYIVKLGFTGAIIIFLVSAQKYRLWVLVRTASTRRFQ